MRARLIFLGIFLTGGIAGWVAYSYASVSALPEPGRLETAAATWAKRKLVSRDAHGIEAPAGTEQSAQVGRMQYVARCAMCHGQDARTPGEAGRWMYPRASDLGSPEVQRWSDGELFYVIQNGIRLTGMPGFGKAMSDEEIWPLVHYIRRVGREAAAHPREKNP